MKAATGRYLLALVFLGAGITHFTKSALFVSIVPPHFGDPLLDVRLSGIAEMLGAIGLLIPATRKAAAIGLLLLLLAVWPANWYMALHPDRFAAFVPAWILWVRLPMQLLLAAFVVRAGGISKRSLQRGRAREVTRT